MHNEQNIAVLMGPTGTGKSALALAVAQRRPTVIINADAMQMVADLRTITARPSVAEEAQAEHALYGVLRADEPTSVARWVALVVPIIERAWSEGKLPLLVGGTCMYVKALREGLAAIPPIPSDIRARVRAMDAPALHAALTARGAQAAFKPGDTQRLARALEVLEATGKPIGWWQQHRSEAALPHADWQTAYLSLPRAELYDRLNRRFVAMMERDALDEVRALMMKELADDTPILRAHGVPELMAYLRGSMGYDDAVARSQQNTRHYAKRQMTWLRQQAKDAQVLDASKNNEGIFS